MWCRALGFRAEGVDIDPAKIQMAREWYDCHSHAATQRLHRFPECSFLCSSVDEQFVIGRQQMYDVIVVFGVLASVANPVELLRGNRQLIYLIMSMSYIDMTVRMRTCES